MSDSSIPGVSFHSLGEGKMGPLVQAHDWSKTSLGPIHSWPKSLKTHVSTMLALPAPSIIFWGEDQVQIYNDGYSVIMGPRHPKHLGSTFKECWPEAFTVIDPWMKRVTQNAEVVVVDKSMIPLTRHGFVEECYFTFTFSPLLDDEGKIGGLLQIVTEITESVLSNRRLEYLRKISIPASPQLNRNESLIKPLSFNPQDIRFALLFLPKGTSSQLELVGTFGIEENCKNALGFEQLMRHVHDTYSLNLSHEINQFQNILPHLPSEPWEEYTQQAMVIPVKSFEGSTPKGVLVLGISPRLKFDDLYRNFFVDTAREFALKLEADERYFQNLEIHRAYNFVNSVIENVPLMIFVKDAKELRFTRFNRAGEELLGYSQEELIGKNDYDFFTKSEADFFTNKDRATLASGKILDIPEEPIQTKFKGQRILHTKKITLYDESGNPEYLLGLSEDISEKKQAEEQRLMLLKEQFARVEAEKMVQQRDDFISIAAHELRTPLTSIGILTHLVSNFLATIEVQNIQKYIEIAQKSVHQVARLSKLIENLLDVTRANSGRLIIDKSETNLSEVIYQTVKNLDPEILRAKCKLELQLDTSIIGMWDVVRIEQILVNLLSNAIKFGAGKPILVSTKVVGTKAMLVVQDQGIGISKLDQERLFNRFERAVSVKSYGGLGLGLYISRQIALAHGGDIRIQSELGSGSSFILELPL